MPLVAKFKKLAKYTRRAKSLWPFLVLLILAVTLPLLLVTHQQQQAYRQPATETARAQCKGLWIPAYFGHPSWDKVAASYPATQIITANFGNGPGSLASSSDMVDLTQMRHAGIRIAGYVNTAHARVSLSRVKAQIDQWKSFYDVTDIMLDNAWAAPDKIPYYAALTQYVHQQTPGAIDQLGAGAAVDEGFLKAGDVIDLFEGPYSQYMRWHAPGYANKYPASKFKVDIYGIPGPGALPGLFKKLTQDNIGYMGLTDSTNPWTELGSDAFFTALVAQVKSACSGRR